MATLRFKIHGVEFELVGEQEEIMAFINRFMYSDVNPTPTIPIIEGERRSLGTQIVHEKPAFKQKTEPLPLKLTEMPVPDMEAVISYIMQKPRFQHDLQEIQMKFFGRTFQSRGQSQRMWHRTSRQLAQARGIIEKRVGGKFRAEPAGERNLKQYTFVSSQATLSAMEGQRTS